MNQCPTCKHFSETKLGSCVLIESIFINAEGKLRCSSYLTTIVEEPVEVEDSAGQEIIDHTIEGY